MRVLRLLVILTLFAMPISLRAQVVQGRLLEAGTRRPVVSAMISLVDSAGVVVRETMSAPDGSFRIEAPDAGGYYVLAEGIGYSPFWDGVDLDDGGLLPFEVFLKPQPIKLDSLIAPISRLRTRQYLTRMGYYKRLGAGFGHFITQEDIEDRPSLKFSGHLRGILRVSTSGGFSRTRVRFRRGADFCEPRLVVDGRAALRALGGAILENAVAWEDVAAMEIYTSPTRVPPQYASINSCGAILIWTKGSGRYD